jgi:hypothetical protein
VTALADAIRAIYVQVDAPAWAAANLDGLLDVLRDLSWLPAGPIALRIPEMSEEDGARLAGVLFAAMRESADGPRPVVLAG